VKPPFTYYGGKQQVADVIVALLPPHEHYVEPFAGSLAVLLAKPPSLVETVNDLDGDVMNLWRVLRDQPEEFERACALTPHSRVEAAQAEWDGIEGLTDVERARRVWVRLTQCRSRSTGRRTGWRCFPNPRGPHPSMPEYLAAYVGRMAPIAARLRGVSLECLPALEIIRRYGQHPGNLLYCDPPYPASARPLAVGDEYAHELRTDDDHAELIEALIGCRAAVALSGYASELYDGMLARWNRREFSLYTGNGGAGGGRTEVLWCNRPFPQGSLFDTEGHAG
jgi:DNA adenine methylase